MSLGMAMGNSYATTMLVSIWQSGSVLSYLTTIAIGRMCHIGFESTESHWKHYVTLVCTHANFSSLHYSSYNACRMHNQFSSAKNRLIVQKGVGGGPSTKYNDTDFYYWKDGKWGVARMADFSQKNVLQPTNSVRWNGVCPAIYFRFYGNIFQFLSVVAMVTISLYFRRYGNPTLCSP